MEMDIIMRTDETWHRLLIWTNGSANSERLSAQILYASDFIDIDPSHPLGGRDEGKDALALKDNLKYVMAAYYPKGQKDFTKIQKKFLTDLNKVNQNNAHGIAFVTNQEITIDQRKTLANLADKEQLQLDLFHLERIVAILDQPSMFNIRKQFLDIDNPNIKGTGGTGGKATVKGNNSVALGGHGGLGGISGKGGKGGDAEAMGNNVFAIGGDGGNAGQKDGRGGQGAIGPMERLNGPNDQWKYGAGGSAANHPEYNRRLDILINIRKEYLKMFPQRGTFIEAGIDIVPLKWVNKRLEEMKENWRVQGIKNDGGYIMPNLD